MDERFSRTALLLGRAAMERLGRARVAVFGLGGVGGHAAEVLVRSGVGALDLLDSDRVSPSNLNRQLFATRSTVGRLKVDAARERLLDIAPDADIRTYPVFFGPDTAGDFEFARYDYIIDAIDTVTGKLLLIQQAQAAGTPVISCMGAGNKLDPTAFRVADIYETSVCPLARIMRKELKRRGVDRLKVVYSTETPREPDPEVYEALGRELEESGRRQLPGSCAFVPAAAGLILAGEVVKDLALRGDRLEDKNRILAR